MKLKKTDHSFSDIFVAVSLVVKIYDYDGWNMLAMSSVVSPE